MDGSLTYAQLDARSDQIGAWLAGTGLKRGETVLFQTGNLTEGVLAFYAFLKAGAVPVATLAAHRGHEIGQIGSKITAVAHVIDVGVSSGALVPFALENARASHSIRDVYTVGGSADGLVRLTDMGLDIDPDSARATVRTIQAGIDPEDVAVFQLSGGTTGTPKLIPRIHAEYWNNALRNSRQLERDETSRIAHALPFIHNAGIVHSIFGAHSVGGCAVTMPFAPAEQAIAFLIASDANDMMIGSAMAPWTEHPLWSEFSPHLKRLMFSGSKVPASLFDRIEVAGTWIGQVWGMAEGPYTSTAATASVEARKQTVGTPVHEMDEVRILDVATGVPVTHGTTGLLTVRGPSTIAGYFDAPEHNIAAILKDEFLVTGDLGRVCIIDGVEYLSIEGRIKDVISRGGEKISTEEIEKLLLAHPLIREAAVVAMPDPRLGERACAYLVHVQPDTRISLDDIRAHFGQLGVAKYKWPERLEWIEALPRTNTLKIDKVKLRDTIHAIVLRETERSAAPEASIAP